MGSLSRRLIYGAVALLAGCSGENPPDNAGGAASFGGSGAMATGGQSTAGSSSMASGGAGGNGIGGASAGGTGASMNSNAGSTSSAGAGGSSPSGGAAQGGSAQGGVGTGATGGGASSGAGGMGGAPTGSVPLDPALLSKCSGTSPITCAFPAPNGNYDVTVELGDPTQAGSSLVQAETRHNQVALTATNAGTTLLQTFTVNVRQEVHDGGQSAPANILNLLIGGANPRLHGVGIRPAPNSITIFVAGDSTLCDWAESNSSSLAPDEAGWAQELSLYLKPGVAVANYADSGETAGSFYGKFFPAARTAMRAGDYLFIQFGHNDQKATGDISAYSSNLMRYVTDARAKNVTPVLFSPVSRSSATAGSPGFAGLDEQARNLAAQQNIAFIDLTTLSRNYYATVPNKSALFIDGTHFHETGAVQVAGVVARAIAASTLPLKDFVK